jgi:hypothetical protein
VTLSSKEAEEPIEHSPCSGWLTKLDSNARAARLDGTGPLLLSECAKVYGDVVMGHPPQAISWPRYKTIIGAGAAAMSSARGRRKYSDFVICRVGGTRDWGRVGEEGVDHEIRDFDKWSWMGVF